MKNIPKNGFAYINQFLEQKERPAIDSELIGITINYQDV